MSESTHTRGAFWKGLLILLLAPVAVLGAFAAYVHLANRAAQPGPLAVSTWPETVLPWQDAHYVMTVRPPATGTKPPIEPMDMAFLIDMSGSMRASAPAMAKAVADAVGLIGETAGGQVRFALARFDTDAETLVDWTSNADAIRAGLSRLAPFTGQNDARKVFALADELTQRARPGVRRAVVFYTDGYLVACPASICPSGPMQPDEIVAAASALRGRGVEFFSVGPPGEEAHSLMIDITGGSARVFTPTDLQDLAANFETLVTTLGHGGRNGGRLAHDLDGRYFNAPLAGTAWTQDPSGVLRLELGPLSTIERSYAHPIEPLAAGLWQVGVSPARLTYADDAGAIVQADGPRRPLMLVVTWFALALGFLPALVWMLTWRPAPAARVARPAADPVVADLPLPSALPVIPAAAREGEPPIPTLFIGLGGEGFEGLKAIRADLKQAHAGIGGQPYHFLALDLDRRSGGVQTIDEWSEHPIERNAAPAALAQAAAYCPAPDRVPERWSWFDATAYEHKTVQDLNLAEGAQGDRMLARLGLFQWLDQHDLVSVLDAARERLMAPAARGGLRQIVVVGSADGGVGSGWMLDIGRICKRIARRAQGTDTRMLIPEVIGIVIAQDAGATDTRNRDALLLELETSSLTGAFPRRTTYRAGDALLDRVDTESPFDWVFWTSDSTRRSVAAQCGQVGAVLCQPDPRSHLLRAIRSNAHPAPVLAHGVHVVATLVRERVQTELILRVLGPEILLDVQPAAGGVYEPIPIAEADAARALRAWAAAHAPGSQWARLIAAAADDTGAAWPAVATVLAASDPALASQWLTPALCASVSRMLHGHREAGGRRWIRDWSPGMAVAVLRVFDRQLEKALSGPHAGPTAPARAMLDLARANARDIASALEVWVLELSGLCTRAAERHRGVTARFAELGTAVRRRTYLDLPVTPGELEAEAHACLERWLHAADTTSPLRERLYFAAVAHGGQPGVLLRCVVEPARDLMTPSEAVASLDGMMWALASLAPAARLSAALTTLDAKRQHVLARGLVDAQTSPSAVIVVHPAIDALRPIEANVVSSFVVSPTLPDPAHHGPRTTTESGDQSAVRRIEVSDRPPVAIGGAAPHVIEMTERESERLRARASQRAYMEVPLFPAHLRVAVAAREAFQRFARAYKTRRIVRRADAHGREQWYDADASRFLTFGEHDDLAHAAATFAAAGDGTASDGAASVAGSSSTPPGDATHDAPAGAMAVTPADTFAALEEWRTQGGRPGHVDVIVQAAIDVADS